MYSAQCFRLESFLIALDVSQVDLLSLDVEGAEEEILRNFDFGRFKIEVRSDSVYVMVDSRFL